MRYAIYYTPPQDDPLTRSAQAWLGRDAFADEPVAQPLLDTPRQSLLFEQTAAPRRYGFHATIVAPFRLVDGCDETDLVASLEEFCAGRSEFDLKLTIGRLGPFLALVPAGPSPEVGRLAADAVRLVAPLRAPMTEEEMARRNPGELSPMQLSNLKEWGYPYVMEEFRFHMTLTGALPHDMLAIHEDLLQDRFAPLLENPVTIDRLAIFAEAEKAGPFTVMEQFPFGGREDGGRSGSRPSPDRGRA